MINEKGEALRNTQMEITMKVNLLPIKLMEREFISGGMENSMMGSGTWVPRKGMEFGEEHREIAI